MEGDFLRKDGVFGVVRADSPDGDVTEKVPGGMCLVVLQEYAEAALLTWSGAESGCLVVNLETSIEAGPSCVFVKPLCQTQWVGFVTSNDEERDEWITALLKTRTRTTDVAESEADVKQVQSAEENVDNNANASGITTEGSTNNGDPDANSGATPMMSDDTSLAAVHKLFGTASQGKGAVAQPVIDAHSEIRRLREIVERQAETITNQAREIQDLHRELATEQKSRNEVVENNLLLAERRTVEVAMIDQLAQLLVTPMWQGSTDEDKKESLRLVEEIRAVAQSLVAEARPTVEARAKTLPLSNGAIQKSLTLNSPWPHTLPCKTILTTSATSTTTTPVMPNPMGTTPTSAYFPLSTSINGGTPSMLTPMSGTTSKYQSNGGSVKYTPDIGSNHRRVPSAIRVVPMLSSVRPPFSGLTGGMSSGASAPGLIRTRRENDGPLLKAGPRIGSWNRPQRSVSPGGRFFSAR